jgi:carboxymethylenebutenolidase
MLIHYAGDDERINAGIPEFEAAMKEAGVEHVIHMYEGAKHAFFNDTSERYHEEAAKLAWKRTLAWFDEKLKA